MLLELSLHAINLKNVAGAFKGTSDPYAVVTDMSSGTAKPIVLGKTEVVKNTLNPEWVTLFPIDYTLGKPIKVVVSIFDEVSKGNHKSMGSVVFDIGEVLGSRGNTKAKKIPKSTGTIFASVRPSHGQGNLKLQLKGYKLTNTEGFMKKSDPFFEILRNINAAGGLTWDNVFRSKTIQDNLNPAWELVTLPLSSICGGDVKAPIRVNVFDYESSGRHVLMGTIDTTVQQVVDASTNGKSEDLSKAFTIKVKGKDTGKLIVVQASLEGLPVAPVPATVPAVTQQLQTVAVADTPKVAPVAAVSGTPTFADYISGGCQLNVVVAIDFTGSNGDPRKPGTLHHIDPNSKNDYEKAISSIVEILAKYDHDQTFPVYGFGAKYNGVVNHCFNISGGSDNAGVKGVDGILQAYNAVFKSGFVMSSPTVFTEVIEVAAAKAQVAADSHQTYTVLLIVTDGAVTDPVATAATINRIANTCPLSIVIVGVGNADFSSMQYLDDNIKKPGTRDVVQFVELNKHASSKADLTEATLSEIPNQLVQYFQSKNIPPNPPIKLSEKDIIIDEDDDEPEIDLSITEEGDIVVTGDPNKKSNLSEW